ncbi:hypothetical protein DY000_02020091 [Brassica cretica]|uniref:Uncharacterized protein n=1 Tax=Brassica cretica TaxID=69181 RepID=A0ABQ7ECR9_BRACR|nr:hypothetical protein DY000_02020091 [Brassica cretica]
MSNVLTIADQWAGSVCMLEKAERWLMVVGRTDWIEGGGADCVLTDPGVIMNWFWDAKHG